ncbi:MAG: MFS transporter [Nanoarchaeota archaeon]
MKEKGVELKAKRNAWFLGSSSFLNDVGGDMISSILPFYIGALGGGGVAIGLISGLREGLSSIFKIFGGWLSDRIGKRKIFVFLGYFFSFIFKFFIGLATTWQSLLWFVSLERFGKFRDAPRDAIIADSLNHRGKNFGIIQMLDTLGGVVGTLIVIFLFWKFGFEFKTIIFLAAVISFFSIVPIFFVKEPKIKAIKKNLLRGVEDLDGRLKYFVFVVSVFSFANFGLYMFLMLMAEEITGSVIYPLLFYILFNLVYAIFVTPFGELSDRFGRKRILLAGYFLFLIITIGFIFLSNFVHLFILFSLYGLVYAITNSSQRALVSDLAGEMKGTALGFFYTAMGLVSIPGGLVAGILWDINHKLMFEYLSVVAFVAVILLCFVKGGKKV